MSWERSWRQDHRDQKWEREREETTSVFLFSCTALSYSFRERERDEHETKKKLLALFWVMACVQATCGRLVQVCHVTSKYSLCIIYRWGNDHRDPKREIEKKKVWKWKRWQDSDKYYSHGSVSAGQRVPLYGIYTSQPTLHLRRRYVYVTVGGTILETRNERERRKDEYFLNLMYISLPFFVRKRVVHETKKNFLYDFGSWHAFRPPARDLCRSTTLHPSTRYVSVTVWGTIIETRIGRE